MALHTILSHLHHTSTYNLSTLQHAPLSELSGSLGDLGTLLPLLLALTLTNSISLPSTLLFTGLSNIFTGLVFGLPLPVQPMKAIAAVAISNRYSVEETAAAGIAAGAVVGLLGVTGTIKWVTRAVPVPVVKGVQVGAGLSLCLSAGEKLLKGVEWRGPSWADNLSWALVAAVGLCGSMVWNRGGPRRKVPFALCVFVLGVAFAVVLTSKSPSRHDPSYRPTAGAAFPLVIPSPQTFVNSFFSATLPQLPLTVLNSIIAVTALASDLFPSSSSTPPPPSPTSLSLSIAAMNLVQCWFGAMPTCHGAGGLAAQHAFGARSGASVILLGLFKLGLGIAALVSERAGYGIVEVVMRFPKALLAVLVVGAGVELARAGWAVDGGRKGEDDGDDESVKEEKRRGVEVLLLTVAGTLAVRNVGVGFLAGMGWHLVYVVSDWWERRRHGRIRLGEDSG